MFDILVREVAARFGLGDKALPFVQMVLGYMTNQQTGGLAGFMDKFKAAGLGSVVQSWMGGAAAPQAVSNNQIESVLGGAGGLLSTVTSKLGVGRDNATSALGYLLPAVIGKLTAGGSIPSVLPAEVSGFASAGQNLLGSLGNAGAAAAAGAAATTAAVKSSGGGLMKWLPWLVLALAALFGLNYCSKPKTEVVVTPPAPVASEPVVVVAPAPAVVASEPAPVASAPAVVVETPKGSGILAALLDGVPAMKVYFDTGKTDVHADFANLSKDLVAYVKDHGDAKVSVSGFNDPRGNAAKNAELSKNRAKAVKAALVAAGVPEDRVSLDKPADTTAGANVSDDEARRVEVTVKK